MFGVNIEEEKNIVKDYTENKICITKLQKKYHHNQRVITAVLDKYNIPHGRGVLRTGQSNTVCKRSFTQEDKELIYNIYTNGGTIKDCMQAVHCGQDALRTVLQELNIYKSHKDIMQKLPQNQRKYYVNDEFFTIQSSNLAYLLGFIASDGYVSKDRNEIGIGLSAVDKEHLIQFQKVIGGRNIDEYTTNDGFDVVKWVFVSETAKTELAKYNIIPQKTFKLLPPKQLEKKYWIDYIRGYFDGDGSVNYLNQGALRWQICSATKEILQWIIDFFYEEYNIPKVNILMQMKTNPLYYFQYSTNATKQIYNILYTEDSWYLKRKKDKFEEILKKI